MNGYKWNTGTAIDLPSSVVRSSLGDFNWDDAKELLVEAILECNRPYRCTVLLCMSDHAIAGPQLLLWIITCICMIRYTYIIIYQWYFRRHKVYASWKLYRTSISVNHGSHFQVHFVWQLLDGQLYHHHPHGSLNVPFWEYWTSPYSSHCRPYT